MVASSEDESGSSLAQPAQPSDHQVHANEDDNDNEEAEEDSNADIRENMRTALMDGLPWRTSCLIKSLYFLEALSSATWGRFGVLYYHAHGFGSREIGLVEFVLTVVPIVVIPMWGYLSDVHNCRKMVYVTTKACSTVILLLLAAPAVYNHKERIWMVTVATKLFVAGGILDSYTLDLLGTKNKLLYGRYRLFASLSWGIGALGMGWSTDHFGFEPNFVYYGSLGLLCLLLVIYFIPGDRPEASQSINHDGNNHDGNDGDDGDDGGGGPNNMGQEESGDQSLMRDANNLTEPLLDAQDDDEVSEQQRRQADAHDRDTPSDVWLLLRVFCRPQVMLFLLQVVVMGAAMATSERLLFLYMVDDLQSSTMLCGMSVAVNVIFELPLFFYAETVHGWFGLDGLQWIAMLCFATRAYGYTLLEPATRLWILPLESLHGITFGCFWIVLADVSKALVEQVEVWQRERVAEAPQEDCPPDVTSNAGPNNQAKGTWSTTIPTTVQMLYSAVGVGLGSVIGGWAMQHYGSKPMYRCMAFVMFVTWMLHSLGCIVVRCCGRPAVAPSLLPQCHAVQDATSS